MPKVKWFSSSGVYAKSISQGTLGDRYLGGIKEATLLGKDKDSGQALMSIQGSHVSFPQDFGVESKMALESEWPGFQSQSHPLATMQSQASSGS